MSTEIKTYPYISGMGFVDLELTQEQAQRGHHQGPCDADIEALVPELKDQLDKIDPDLLRQKLAEEGAWSDVELEDDQQNRYRIVWIACGDICDNGFSG